MPVEVLGLPAILPEHVLGLSAIIKILPAGLPGLATAVGALGVCPTAPA